MEAGDESRMDRRQFGEKGSGPSVAENRSADSGRSFSNISNTLHFAPEENEHAVFEVYAAPIHASDEYFRAVRRELEDALGEGVILIERQRVTLI